METFYYDDEEGKIWDGLREQWMLIEEASERLEDLNQYVSDMEEAIREMACDPRSKRRHWNEDGHYDD